MLLSNSCRLVDKQVIGERGGVKGYVPAFAYADDELAEESWNKGFITACLKSNSSVLINR